MQRQKRNIDKKLLIITLTLSFVGLLVIADASAPQALRLFDDRFYFVKQQVVWGFVGLAAMFVVSKIHYSVWEKFATYIFFASVVGLVAVVIPGFGSSVLGAKRWLILGPITIQPSELAKLALVIYFAKLSSKGKKALAYFLPLGLVAGLIMLEPDLGTTLVVTFTSFVQIFVAGVSLVSIGLFALLGGLLSTLTVLFSDYRRQRLMTFLSGTSDPLGTGYHIRQVLLAIGSGGLFGVGIGRSRQKFLFLPEAATDSVFAIVAEEIGFVGTLLLVILLAAFVYKALGVAARAPDTFSKILATGIVAWIGGQVFMNIFAMLAIIPLTGIPLPFISYGGSALTMILISTGILLNISKHAKA